MVEPVRSWRLLSGQVHIQIGNPDQCPALNVAFFPGLLVALLCFANAVVDVRIVSATLDLDGDQISELT